jgi:cellulose biosynthesis protein BcsQ
MSRNALHAASQALVVTEPGYFALRGAQQAVEAIDLVRESSNRTLQPPTIVLNRMRSTVAEHRNRAAELREVFDRQVSSIEIPERNAIAQAEGAGMPIHAWDSPAGRELAELFDSLLDRLFPGGLR